MTSGTFRLRPYRDGDGASINQGFNETFGHARSLEEWRWKFQPEAGGCSIVLAVDASDRVVAHFAVMRVAVQVDGRVRRAGYSVDAYCLKQPGARQERVYVKTVREFYRQYGTLEELAFLFGFPGERHMRFGRLRLQFADPVLVPVWRRSVLARRLWPMMLGIVVGTIAGARLLTGTNTKWTTVGLGVALAAYALHSLLARPLTVSKPPALITSPAPINWKAFRILSAYAEATGGTRVRGDRTRAVRVGERALRALPGGA